MTSWWQAVIATNPPPAESLLFGSIAAAALLTWCSPVWRVCRHLVTVVHEGAHALVAVLVGRSLSGIRLHSDSSGLTISRGKPRGLGMIATLFVGYVGCGVLGLGAAALLHEAHAVLMLWLLLMVLAVMVLQIRNLYGVWVVFGCIAALVAATKWLPVTGQVAFAYTVTWFLLLAALRSVWQLHRTRQARRVSDCDPDQLARLSFLPAGAWVLLMALSNLVCLWVGGLLLVGQSQS